MARLLKLAIAVQTVVILLSAPAMAEKRVALVIGNSAYVNVPRLTNPDNDARLMADTLRSLGFTLVGGGAQLDLNEDGFRRVAAVRRCAAGRRMEALDNTRRSSNMSSEFFVEAVAYQQAAIEEMERRRFSHGDGSYQGQASQIARGRGYIKMGVVKFPRSGCEQLDAATRVRE